MEPIVLSPDAYEHLQRNLSSMTVDRPADLCGRNVSLFGVPLQVSTAFPMRFECAPCEGSGEGQTSTYCPGCSGAGKIEAVGCMPGSLITRPLPRRFDPSFPRGIVRSSQLCRGLV